MYWAAVVSYRRLFLLHLQPRKKRVATLIGHEIVVWKQRNFELNIKLMKSEKHLIQLQPAIWLKSSDIFVVRTEKSVFKNTYSFIITFVAPSQIIASLPRENSVGLPSEGGGCGWGEVGWIEASSAIMRLARRTADDRQRTSAAGIVPFFLLKA